MPPAAYHVFVAKHLSSRAAVPCVRNILPGELRVTQFAPSVVPKASLDFERKFVHAWSLERRAIRAQSVKTNENKHFTGTNKDDLIRKFTPDFVQ